VELDWRAGGASLSAFVYIAGRFPLISNVLVNCVQFVGPMSDTHGDLRKSRDAVSLVVTDVPR
jgi:hypothetical protein